MTLAFVEALLDIKAKETNLADNKNLVKKQHMVEKACRAIILSLGDSVEGCGEGEECNQGIVEA